MARAVLVQSASRDVAIGPQRHFAAPNNNVAMGVTTDIDRRGYRMHRSQMMLWTAPRRDRENPFGSSHFKVRANDWAPIRAKHYGQRLHRPHKQAGHMTAPDQCCSNVRKFLPRRRPHMTDTVDKVGDERREGLDRLP